MIPFLIDIFLDKLRVIYLQKLCLGSFHVHLKVAYLGEALDFKKEEEILEWLQEKSNFLFITFKRLSQKKVR
jgi:hypothetical protein